MTKMKTKKLARSIGIGLAVAGATAAVGSAVWSTGGKRKVKSRAKQFARTVGDIVDNVQSMMH